jgi:hypothetical protein
VIALSASIILTLYLLIPGSIFGLILGLFVPLRSFDRTRGEEILRGVLSTLLPFILSLLLVWMVKPFDTHPFAFPDTSQARRADYKLVVSGLYSEDLFKHSGDLFWKALTRTGRRQGRFLVWYYSFIILEGWGFGALCVSYPKYKENRSYRWAAKHVLLPSISEWHVLLTPFFFSDKSTVVRADILCSDNNLYRGAVAEHFLDKEGQLRGMIITDALRYDRITYLKDRDAAIDKHPVNKDNYWHAIPGAKLYIFADKIQNLNLSYDSPAPSLKEMADLISRALRQKFQVTIDSQP